MGDRTRLVEDLARFVGQWEVMVRQPGPPLAAQMQTLEGLSRDLRNRARHGGLGGVDHHLGRLEQLVNTRFDRDALRATLQDVSTMLGQLKQELSSAQQQAVSPPLLGAMPRREQDAPPRIEAPPRIDYASGSLAPPPFLTVHPDRQEAPAPAAPPAFVQSTEVTPPHVLRPTPAPIAPPAPPHVASPAPASPAPHPPVSQRAPKLLVRTMFGLRAFGRSPEPSAPPSPSIAPQAPGEQGALLGLRNISGSRAGSGGAGGRSQKPPPMLSSLAPPLNPARGASPETKGELEGILGRIGKGSKGPARDTGRRKVVTKRPGAAPARPPASSSGLLWLLAGGVVLASVALIVGVIVWSRTRDHSDQGSAAASASGAPAKSTAPGDGRGAPRERLSTDDERFKALLSQVHGHGGKESPELRALVDDQAALQSKLLGSGQCDADPALCAKLSKARDLAIGPGGDKRITRRERFTGEQPRSKWLMGLHMPDIEVADEPRVQRVFEYYTENRVGRERFQAMLFRCGAYRDLIQATLVRHEAPTGLLAVVLTESGCEPLAKSPVGARGLWQFMPEAARAYHMRVVEDVIDERISPPKSTEAGIRFLSDLKAKLGSWDLAFAAYNVGPFGLLGRIARAGGDVGFWDLADADMLPDETANYVPTIEAFALILENLQQLKFAGSQMRSPEFTADLEVTPGTRLGLVARAAATSISQIHSLNLDVLGDRVPNVSGGLFPIQVPKEVVWQARDTLQALMSASNDDDLCVPPSFDWGKQRFTPEMEADCRRRSQVVTTAPPGSAP